MDHMQDGPCDSTKFVLLDESHPDEMWTALRPATELEELFTDPVTWVASLPARPDGSHVTLDTPFTMSIQIESQTQGAAGSVLIQGIDRTAVLVIRGTATTFTLQLKRFVHLLDGKQTSNVSRMSTSQALNLLSNRLVLNSDGQIKKLRTVVDTNAGCAYSHFEIASDLVHLTLPAYLLALALRGLTYQAAVLNLLDQEAVDLGGAVHNKIKFGSPFLGSIFGQPMKVLYVAKGSADDSPCDNIVAKQDPINLAFVPETSIVKMYPKPQPQQPQASRNRSPNH